MEHVNQRTIDGDNEAFQEWMQPLLHRVECFAIQYGVSLQDAATVAETVFKDIYQQRHALIVEKLHEQDVFRTTLKLLEEFQLKPVQDRLFPFEEDDKLHNRVIALKKEWRVPFILSQFQKKSAADISEILKLTVGEVDNLLAEAFQLLNEPKLEKKLEFLQTSYDRLSSLCNEERIFIHESSPVPEKKITKSKRKPFYLWGVGTAILLALLFLSVTKSEAYQKSIGEKFIEKSKKEFEEELDSRLQLAGLPKREEAGSDPFFRYGELTKVEFSNWITKLKKDLDANGEFDRKKARAEYNALLSELKLPSELIDELMKKSLVKDQIESMKLINELFERSVFLNRSYMLILEQHEGIVFNAEWTNEGAIDVEDFLANQSSYPQVLQDALKGMETQNFILYSEPNSSTLYPKFGDEKLMVKLQEYLHPRVGIYVNIMMAGFEGITDLSVDEQVDLLFTIEKDLLENNLLESEFFNQMVTASYAWLLYSIIGIEPELETKSYDVRGVIKPEYKEAWIKLASHGESSPVSKVMTTIVEQMEDNGWKVSAIENKMTYINIYGDIWNLLEERKEKSK